MKKENSLVSISAVLVMFLWALCYPLVATGLSYVPPLFYGFLRALLSGLVLLGLGRFLGRPQISGRRNWVLVCAIGFTATTIGFWGMFYAGGILSPGLATVLSNTQPLIAAALALPFLHERIDRRALMGLLIGFFGVLLVSLGSGSLPGETLVLGIAYVLVAAIGLAIGNVIMKMISTSVDTINAMGWQLFIGAMPLALLSIAGESYHTSNLDVTFLINLLILSLLGTALPFVIWFWLLQKKPLHKLNSYSFLTPVIGLGLGYIFYAESLTVVQFGGVVAVISGVWLVNEGDHSET
jgi:drug/metabolite transporter (DMT)-like permease